MGGKRERFRPATSFSKAIYLFIAFVRTPKSLSIAFRFASRPSLGRYSMCSVTKALSKSFLNSLRNFFRSTCPYPKGP